MFYMT